MSLSSSVCGHSPLSLSVSLAAYLSQSHLSCDNTISPEPGSHNHFYVDFIKQSHAAATYLLRKAERGYSETNGECNLFSRQDKLTAIVAFDTGVKGNDVEWVSERMGTEL